MKDSPIKIKSNFFLTDKCAIVKCRTIDDWCNFIFIQNRAMPTINDQMKHIFIYLRAANK